MKKSFKILSVALALVLCVPLLLIGCDKIFPQNGDEYITEELSAPDYSTLELSEHVKLGQYKDIRIALGHIDIDMTADVALWDSIVRNAEVIKYPEDALSYYKKQAELRYKYHAEEGNMSYAELLSSLGITEKDVEDEAKEYVKSDLVQLAIIKAEGLHLTDDEKTRLFDKYAYKFSTTYGYTDEYVRENLAEEIYDAMQYDKMMEFLLLNNEVIENHTEEE